MCLLLATSLIYLLDIATRENNAFGHCLGYKLNKVKKCKTRNNKYSFLKRSKVFWSKPNLMDLETPNTFKEWLTKLLGNVSIRFRQWHWSSRLAVMHDCMRR